MITPDTHIQTLQMFVCLSASCGSDYNSTYKTRIIRLVSYVRKDKWEKPIWFSRSRIKVNLTGVMLQTQNKLRSSINKYTYSTIIEKMYNDMVQCFSVPCGKDKKRVLLGLEKSNLVHIFPMVKGKYQLFLNIIGQRHHKEKLY